MKTEESNTIPTAKPVIPGSVKMVVNVRKSMLNEFDELVNGSIYIDRSEYIRAMIRGALAGKPVGEPQAPPRLSPEGVCALCERGDHRSCLTGLRNSDGSVIKCSCQDRRHRRR